MKMNFRSLSPVRSSPAERASLLAGETSASGRLVDQSQRGVALVITLIMLSVTLVMAVAFLAISRRDRASVSTTTDITTARLAGESALARAQAQIIVNLTVNTNLKAYSILVSTNYINPVAFLFGNNSALPNNVNYVNAMNSGSPDELAQNIANLQVLPRAPVMMSSNEIYGRFYLDLNRNGIFEPNGNQPQYAADGEFIHTDGSVSTDLPNVITNFMVGDPEWVGILAKPDAPHSADNPFVARYAFVAQPIGNTLDFNYIHNQAIDSATATYSALDMNSDAYFRNQGVGSWEINLAAFLTDLNTNEWFARNGYEYNRPYRRVNTGLAFNDAFTILDYRYANNYNSLAAGFAPFRTDNIDEYSDGPLQLATTNIVERTVPDLTGNPWAGSDNTNRYFVLDDLFNLSAVQPFAQHLQAAQQNISSYNRYTYYRMLDQIGVDSAPVTGKLNLNYDNVTVTNMRIVGASSTASVTNFLAWTPLGLFTNAAERLLREYTTIWYQTNPSNYLAVYYGYHTNGYLDLNGAGLTNFPYYGMTNQIPSFGVTNIPVIYNGNVVYAPAVNRLLQLAANIVDATGLTNSTVLGLTNFPSVFKPHFYRTNQNVVINGYQLVGVYVPLSAAARSNFQLPEDFNALIKDTSITNPTNTVSRNVWGIPWIVGAKKGFPNFNEFSFDNTINVTRRLAITRPKNRKSLLTPSTNQSFVVSINTQLGGEMWNSYANAYPSKYLAIEVYDYLTVSVRSSNGLSLVAPVPIVKSSVVTLPSAWPGTGWKNGTFGSAQDLNPNSFVIPLYESTNVLPNASYSFFPSPYFQDVNAGLIWDSSYPPKNFDPMFVQTTNYVRIFMLDGPPGNQHVIDYVQFASPVETTNITAVFQGPNLNVPEPTSISGPNSNMWTTLPNARGIPLGVVNQIELSRNSGTGWATQNPKDVDKFYVFMGGPVNSVPFPAYATDPDVLAEITNTSAQVPYNPTVTIHDYTTFQANDPLVHYLASDLPYYGPDLSGKVSPGVHPDSSGSTNNTALPNLGQLNNRFAPWGTSGDVSDGNPNPPPNSSARYSLNTAVQDPLVWSSDFWEFPTNKFPTVGWLGRVHRGTPWQTVYLKSRNVWTQTSYGPTTWELWTSDFNLFDAAAASPTGDRYLFDLFTTAPDNNAATGLLSVNQKGLAAWSALFSGMVALENTNNSIISGTVFSYGSTNINPAGINTASSALGQMVNGPAGINATRANINSFPGGSFLHVGDILATPSLTDQSPFFNTNRINGAGVLLTNGITDAAYEWLPQQAMSLLKLDDAPRYVIYCYGQTLKPVQGALVTSGVNFGLTTNYQVVAESAARAVVQVHANVVVQNGISTTNYSTTVESYNVLPPD